MNKKYLKIARQICAITMLHDIFFMAMQSVVRQQGYNEETDLHYDFNINENKKMVIIIFNNGNRVQINISDYQNRILNLESEKDRLENQTQKLLSIMQRNVGKPQILNQNTEKLENYSSAMQQNTENQEQVWTQFKDAVRQKIRNANIG